MGWWVAVSAENILIFLPVDWVGHSCRLDMWTLPKKRIYAVTSSGYRKLIDKILKLFMKSVRLFGIFCLKFLHQFLASKILNAHIVFAVISLLLYKTNFKQSYDLQTDDIAQIRSWTKEWERWERKSTPETHTHIVQRRPSEWMLAM